MGMLSLELAVIDGGFYYDFDMDEKVSSDDFEKIEKNTKQMLMKIIKLNVSCIKRS